RGITPLISSGVKLFAAKGNGVYDVTAGGTGPFPAESGISVVGSFWTWINYQNVGGSYLIATNNTGGYALYDGTSWSMIAEGVAPGQISGVNPAFFVYVMEWKRRLWFIEKESTGARDRT